MTALTARSNGRMNDIVTEVVIVTPTMAREMLERNVHNRRVRKSRVESFAGAMRRGEWQFNGESIKFDEDGNLRDGQHRLLAIIESGLSFPILVIKGLPAAAQETLDIGAKRTVADMLQLRGHTNVHALAATARYALLYYRDKTLLSRPPEFTPQQVIAYIEDHPTLNESVKLGRRVNLQIGGSGSMWAALNFLGREVDQEDATVFFEQLITGVPPLPGEPVHQLRKAVVAEGLKPSRRADAATLGAWAVKAFNAWRDGSEAHVLYWRRGGARREPFPAIKDHPAGVVEVEETDRAA